MNSFISWIGGKKLLRKEILAQFPEEYSRYIEVFGGAGWILFGREGKVDLEVYNDVNSNLVNLYRCVKYHPDALQKELDGILMSRELFFDAVEGQSYRGMTDIQKAACFFVTIKESFGSSRTSFGLRPKNMNNAVEYLKKASERLQMVVIENMDFEHILKTYDRESALFYLDPPYYDAEKYYPDRFDVTDHDRLKNALDRIKGKFILSYNDCPEIRNLYKSYVIIATERNDSLATKVESRKYKELIIKNF